MEFLGGTLPMKIKCPFCSFKFNHKVSDHNSVLKSADKLRFHLEYQCPIHNVGYVEDYMGIKLGIHQETK